MTAAHLSFAVLLLWGAAAPAGAQVYRCGQDNVFTDKPCSGARALDVRPNLLDAGPRDAPPVKPQPAIILPDTGNATAAPPSDPNTMWQKKDSDDAAHRARTTRH